MEGGGFQMEVLQQQERLSRAKVRNVSVLRPGAVSMQETSSFVVVTVVRCKGATAFLFLARRMAGVSTVVRQTLRIHSSSKGRVYSMTHSMTVVFCSFVSGS